MKNILKIFIVILICIASITSCKKEDNIAKNNKWVYADTVTNTNIRVIHALAANSPNLPTASSTTGPQVFIYANGMKLNGNALSYGGQWPSPSVYATVPAKGNVRFDVVMARLNFNVVPVAAAPMAGDTLFTVTHNMSAGKFYSLYLGDSVGGPYKLESYNDDLTAPAYQKYKIRLANWTMNVPDTFDVWSRREQAIIISDISIKKISNWVELPLPIVSDTLEIRRKNTTTALGSINGFSPTGLRMYTIMTRGKTGVLGKGPAYGFLINR